jgi:hypothetical protein
MSRIGDFNTMTEATIIDFPKGKRSFEEWYGWAECELAILGLEIQHINYDWHAAYTRGLKPEDAAAEAANTANAK